MKSSPNRSLFSDDSPTTPPAADANSGPRRIPGYVVLEPLGEGVRVSARSSDDALLWGMVCSKLMLQQPHASVALYDQLRAIAIEELSRYGREVPTNPETVDAALDTLRRLEEAIASARRSITVKKVSPETQSRARDILRSFGDALQMISSELPYGGMAKRESSEGDE